ncbi:MAG: hypothetical protein NT062_39485, partial [Proteobacteria bacterium]|nr:hypothetical protein [Pseudomonadota bacterium]
MRASLVGLSLVVLASACGDDGGKTGGPDATDIGFNKPTVAVHANDETAPGVWTDLGVAKLDCLGTPTADMATTMAVTLNTVVLDFQSKKVVDGAAVTAFAGIDTGNAFGAAVTTTSEGVVSVMIPAGQKRIGFKMAGGVSGTDTQLDTFLLNQYLIPDMAIQTAPELLSVSNATAQLLPALIGENRTPGSGVLAGAFRDCANNEVSNFVAIVSSTQGTATAIAGASAYYFSSTAKPLPQKHNVINESSANGLFMAIQIPATPTAF